MIPDWQKMFDPDRPSKLQGDLIKAQREFNQNLVNEQKELTKWTKWLVFATWALALATIILTLTT